MPIGLVHDPIFQEHQAGDFHVESPRRLEVLDQALQAWPGLGGTVSLPLRAATAEELGRVHTSNHIKRIAATQGRYSSLDPDTGTSPRSHEVALLAAGSLIDLCDAALEGRVQHGMALVRPPGHHATPERAMGFCLFNNVAIAAAHLLAARGLERVLVVDWDVHHGNGTEDCFSRDERVLYFSVHQSPMYPGTGPLAMVGSGPGLGYTMNVPMMGGQEDSHYLRIFLDLLDPVARAFAPQFILVSAGFDAHREDPLGGMQLRQAGYAGMTKVLMDIAREFCPGRVVLTLEGGYQPAAQARSVLAVLNTFLGDTVLADACLETARQAKPPEVLAKAKAIMAKYWAVFPGL
ncbi:MAG: histone deacetylase [Desulfarculus sp.]|nr:histone deacetylase [Desulfarculus sp.]